ncbi:MAG: hypothetical protein JWM08_2369 [Candidatus Angelobacter sp.]|nr:hypothetical protein [Candidatus Angelobacter sp.]
MQRFQHPVQVRRSAFNVVVLVLAGPAFCRQQATAMNIFEVAVRKLVSCLRVDGFGVVDAQVPLLVFTKPVLADEFVLFFRGWLVLTPGISRVVNKSPVPNQLLSKG